MGSFLKHTWEVTAFIGLMTVLATQGCTTPQVVTKEVSKTEKAKMHLAVAAAVLGQGDATGALKAAMEAEKLDNQLPDVYQVKALAFHGKHDVPSAIHEARRAVKLNPRFSEGNNTLGSLLLIDGKYDEAFSYLDAAAHDPLYRESYKSWTNLGILKYRQSAFHQAKVYFDRAVLDAPQQACSAYYYRGILNQKVEKVRDAIENFKLGSIKHCAAYGDSALALGLAYMKSRDFSKARKIFLEIRDRFPNTKLEEQAMNELRYLP